MAKIKVYLENGSVFIGTDAADMSSTFNGMRPLALNTYPADGFLTASVVDTDKIKVVTSDNKVIFTRQVRTNIIQKNGSVISNTTAAATVIALNAIFDTPVIESFIVKDPNANNSGTTKLRHKAGTGGADRDQAGTLELDSHSASIGLYDSYLKISETDLSNTGGKTAAYGDFRLDLQNASGSSATALRISMGNVYSQAVGLFSFATLGISGNTTFSSSTGTVTFDGDTSGIDYGDLDNVPSTFAPASHNHAASEITSGTFSTARIPGLGSSKITSGTFANARISQSSVTQHQAALAITESQISDLAHYTDASVNTHLNQSGASSGQYLKWTGSDYAWGTISSGGLGNVVEDTSPQLGGQLDANGQSIDMGTNTITDTKVGQWDTAYGWGDHSTEGYLTTLAFSALTGKPTTIAGYGITDAFASLAGDTSPQLGGDLDVNGNKITSSSNGDVTIDPAGTGAIVLRSDNIQFEGAGTVTMSSLKFYEASALEGNFVALKAPLSISSDVTWTLPTADGTSGQVIKSDGSGALSFTTVLSAVNPVMQGTASIQQVAGLSAGLKIFDDDTSHGVRLLAPDLTANVDFTLPAADGSSGQVLKTDGSGNLSFVAQTSDTNTNIANTNLTADNNRTYDLDSNTLAFDLKEGEFLIDDTSDAAYPVNIACNSGAVSILGLNYPAADGTNGQVITTDGVGNLTFSTVSGGGGMTETPFVSMSGRASFGTADTEERVLIGTSYGWSFYNQTVEMGDWSSSDTINSTTHSLAAYIRGQSALQMTSDEKKVRMKVTYRVQNGNSTDFGFSIWSGAIDHNSTSSANLTLRGASATQTVGTSSLTAYKKEFTTTSTITDDAVFLTVEQRGGGSGLSTTCYVYYNIHLFLVD